MDEVISDRQAMRLAIRQAYLGAGFTSPNPLVGCVVLDSRGRLISEGYHALYGQAHAEVNALKNLTKAQLKNAKVFVTLEPCAHEGKTPSCAKMLATLPIKEVVYGLVDLNPLVSGDGAKILQAAGIQATLYSELKNELEKVCEHFLMNFRHKRPFVTLKVASSLDGQLAHASGDSKWITGEAARNFGHYLRGTHDAILVGKNTILVDDPKLNIRHLRFQNKKSKLIVIDPSGEILQHPELQIFKTHVPENIFVVTDHQVAPTKLAHNIIINEKLNGAINLNALLTRLYGSGICSVLVEGGAQTISSFINQKEANRLYLFQASILIGSRTGKPWSEEVIIKSMQDRIELDSPRYKRIGKDLVMTARFPNLR